MIKYKGTNSSLFELKQSSKQQTIKSLITLHYSKDYHFKKWTETLFSYYSFSNQMHLFGQTFSNLGGECLVQEIFNLKPYGTACRRTYCIVFMYYNVIYMSYCLCFATLDVSPQHWIVLSLALVFIEWFELNYKHCCLTSIHFSFTFFYTVCFICLTALLFNYFCYTWIYMYRAFIVKCFIWTHVHYITPCALQTFLGLTVGFFLSHVCDVTVLKMHLSPKL